jgi:hypothetical protein
MARKNRWSRGLVVALTSLMAWSGAAAEPQGARKQVIQVHGHWTIDVRDADGTLVSHNVFENALQPAGQDLLARLLTREASAGGWTVLLEWGGGTTGTLSERNPPPIGPGVGPLTAQMNQAAKVVLSGSLKADGDKQIQSVTTALTWCSPLGPPSVDCTAHVSTFTQHTSAPPNPPLATVQTGQTVDVTVVLSFS